MSSRRALCRDLLRCQFRVVQVPGGAFGLTVSRMPVPHRDILGPHWLCEKIRHSCWDP